MKRFTAFTSRIVPLPIDNVDTDQIIPAEYLKTTEREGLGKALFAGWRYGPDGEPRTDFVLGQPRSEGAQVLLAGDNFGCGSSREHAAWALLDHGFRAVLSTRFADIFRRNALGNGLLPVVVEPAVHRRLLAAAEADPEAAVSVDLKSRRLTLPGGEAVTFPVDPFARRCLLEGVDPLGYLLEQLPHIEAWETRSSGSPTSPSAPRASGVARSPRWTRPTCSPQCASGGAPSSGWRDSGADRRGARGAGGRLSGASGTFGTGAR